MDYGENIKAARKAAGLTQAELAKRCGLATVTVRQYESGKREPRRGQIQAIADALAVNVWELMGFDGSIRVSPPSEQQGKPLKESLDGLMSTLEKIAKTFPAEDKLDWALPRLTDGGKNKVADYALDLVKIPKYRRQEPAETPPASPGDTDTPAAPEGTEVPQKPEEDG